jgi:dGTPase
VRPRERTEQWEDETLHPLAARARHSRGRLDPEAEDDFRTAFQRDRDRIVHAKAFRRLMHKTQVFLAPEGDHYRTRLTHTLEVAQIARTVARALRLNEDLTEAIALAHDLGHPPFGHAGEAALDEAMAPWGGFRHDVQSLRIVERLEQRRRADGQVVAGLNLTWEVRDGIGAHSKGLLDLSDGSAAGGGPATCEGQVVRIADRVAYVHHDTDDAIRAGLIRESEVPPEVTDVLGPIRAGWLDIIVRDVVGRGLEGGGVALSPPVQAAVDRLKDFLSDRVYFSEPAIREAARGQRMLRLLFDYLAAHLHEVPAEVRQVAGDDPPQRAVCDYLAGMTDRYAIRKFSEWFVVQRLESH